MNTESEVLFGAGLGLRRTFLAEIVENPPQNVDFYEVAPENWITIGGRLGKQFRSITERYRFVCHGLSLSLGSTDPLDIDFVKAVKKFMDEHDILLYSEHLSYCSQQGHLYDLMPIPFTQEAAFHVAERIRTVQDILEQKIAIENVSYYAAPGQEMKEIDFLNAVLSEADCNLLIDVNNIYVNSVNHNYDPVEFLHAIPGHRIVYSHVAGHYIQADDFLIDTHGATVIDSVWKLLLKAYELFGIFPTLLERDFNIPALTELLQEVSTITQLQQLGANNNERKSA